jgi:hypothetical protein
MSFACLVGWLVAVAVAAAVSVVVVFNSIELTIFLSNRWTGLCIRMCLSNKLTGINFILSGVQYCVSQWH